MRREKSRLKKAAGRISCAITRTEEDEAQVANGAPAANTKNLNKPQAASGGPGGETKNEDKRFYSSLVVSSRCGILFFVSRPFNIFARLFAVSSSLDLFCHAHWFICSSFFFEDLTLRRTVRLSFICAPIGDERKHAVISSKEGLQQSIIE